MSLPIQSMVKFLILLLFLPFRAQASLLTLEDYLRQVQANHQGFVASQTLGAAAQERSKEGSLIFSPQLFANFQISRDQKQSVLISVLPSYEKLVQNAGTRYPLHWA